MMVTSRSYIRNSNSDGKNVSIPRGVEADVSKLFNAMIRREHILVGGVLCFIQGIISHPTNVEVLYRVQGTTYYMYLNEV